MSKIAFYEGCFVELNNGDHVGPVRMVSREIGDDSPSAYYDDRVCEWNAQGQWTDGDKTNPKNIKRVLSTSEIVNGGFTAAAGASDKPAISQAVVNKGMEAGLKAKPELYEGCYVELNNGEIAGAVRSLKSMATGFPWRTTISSVLHQWTDFGIHHLADPSLDIRQVFNREQSVAAAERLRKHAVGNQEISQAVVDKGMEAGLKAKPAYEEFVRAILTAALAEYNSRRILIQPFQITREAWREALNAGHDKWSNAESIHSRLYDCQIDEIQALLERAGYAAKNESVPEKASPEKTEVQSGLPLYRHKKTGGLYELLGIGNMQSSDWYIYEGGGAYTNCDEQEVAIYRAVTDGRLWVRPRADFEDGRFEEMPHLTPYERAMPAAEGSVKVLDPKADMFTICEWDTREGGKLVLVEWPEGYVLRHHGEIVWRSWEQKANVSVEVSPMQYHGISSDEQLRLIEKISKNSQYGKLKDGPQTAIQAEEIAEHKADRVAVNGSIERLDPLLRYFLTAIYPGDPLRAVGLDADVSDTEVTRTIEANYGKRGGLHTIIRIQITGPAEIKFWKDQ